MTGKKAVSFRAIVTSGSMDYLRDTTADRRFWPVTLPPGEVPVLDEGEVSDGLHDEEDLTSDHEEEAGGGGVEHHEME